MYLGSAFVFVYFSSSVFRTRLAVHSSASVFCLMFKNEKLKRALHPLQLHTVRSVVVKSSAVDLMVLTVQHTDLP